MFALFAGAPRVSEMPVACLVRRAILSHQLLMQVLLQHGSLHILLHTGAVWHILGTVTGIGGALLLLNRAADDGAESIQSCLSTTDDAVGNLGGRVTKLLGDLRDCAGQS